MPATSHLSPRTQARGETYSGRTEKDFTLNRAEARTSEPSAYFSDQPGFWSLAKQLAASSSQVTWGPDVNVAYSEFTTAFGTAATNKSSFLSPLTQVQSAVVNDMKKNGFTVAG